MRLLLDTNVLIWWLEGESRVTPEARKAIFEADAVVVSAATAWEISLKQSLGKLRPPVEDPLAAVEERGYDLLPITSAHAWAGGALPLHHRDPFDRILVAQAQLDGYTLVTRDPALSRYQVAVLAA